MKLEIEKVFVLILVEMEFKSKTFHRNLYSYNSHKIFM